MPLDLAYSRRQLRRSDRPTVSPDHRWLAYEVANPPERSPESDQGGGRFLPNGTPSDIVGTSIEIVATAGGKSRSICRAGVTCWRPSWSPDAHALAFYSDDGGFPQLWLYEIASGKVRRVSDTPIKAKLWWMDKPAWDPEGQEIFVPIIPAGRATPVDVKKEAAAGMDRKKPTVTVYSTGAGAEKETANPAGLPDAAIQEFLIRENNATLAAIDVATGKTRVLVPAESEPRPSCLKVSPDGRWISYLSVFKLKAAAQTDVEYDLSFIRPGGGERVVVASGIDATDRDYYDEPYLWTADSKHVVFSKSKHVWVVDVDASGAGKPREIAADLGEVNDLPFVLTADGTAVLVGLKPDDEKIYYSVKSKKLAILPLDGTKPTVFPTEGEPVTGDSMSLWQPEGGALYLIAEDSAAAQRTIVRAELGSGKLNTVWRGRARLTPVGTATDGTLIVRYENVTTPADFYRFSRDFSKLERLSEVEPRLASVAVGPMENFDTTVPGFDGKLRTVHSAVFLPAGHKKGDRLPGVVFFYAGSPFSSSAQDFGGGSPNSVPVQVLATRGYAVLFLDVPLSPQGQGGNPIQDMADAMLPQIYRAAELGYIDVNRLAIMGQSYGGYSTMAMVTQTNIFRAAVALDGVYDLPGSYARMYPPGGSVNVLWSESGQGRMGTHPWGDLKRYIANSPYYQADRIHTPVLLIHGEKDDTCPVEEAQKMFNALKRLNRSAELAIYAGEGHVPDEWSLVNAVDAAQRMLAFLDAHVRAAPKEQAVH